MSSSVNIKWTVKQHPMPLKTWLSLEVQEGLHAAIRNGWMSEMNPKTNTSIVNTDLALEWAYLNFWLILKCFHILNCMDFRRLDSWQTVSSKMRRFLLSYSTISGLLSDDSNIASIGLNEFRSVIRRWYGDFSLLIQLVRVSIMAGFIFFQHLRWTAVWSNMFVSGLDEWQRLQNGSVVLFHLARFTKVGSCCIYAFRTKLYKHSRSDWVIQYRYFCIGRPE